MRCVFDTNVLISALLLPDSKPRQALDAALQHGMVLLSLPVLAELYGVLTRTRFRKYITEDDVRSFVAALTREVGWVEVSVRLIVCRDPEDDKLLELAVSGKATHLVTGDGDLVSLNPFRDIQILSPASFLKMLQ